MDSGLSAVAPLDQLRLIAAAIGRDLSAMHDHHLIGERFRHRLAFGVWQSAQGGIGLGRAAHLRHGTAPR
jgi:hypothetical protein